jgi:hypothetical protein
MILLTYLAPGKKDGKIKDVGLFSTEIEVQI